MCVWVVVVVVDGDNGENQSCLPLLEKCECLFFNFGYGFDRIGRKRQ